MNIDFDLLRYGLTGEYDEVMLDKQIQQLQQELERYKNIVDEIESIVYADISNIDVRISIQELLDKLKELKGE